MSAHHVGMNTSKATQYRLDAAQEKELAKAIEVGLYAGHALATGQRPCGATETELQRLVADGEQAWASFVETNLGMVTVLVKRWCRGSPADYEEVQHEGRAALIEAIVAYDYALGWRFSTYAWRIIARRVAHAAVAGRSCGTANFNHARRAARLERSRAELTMRLGRQASVEELAASLGLEADAIRQALQSPQRAHVEAERLASVPSEPPEMEDDLSWLSRMPADEVRVLTLYFGLNGETARTLSEISELLGLSVSGIYRIKRRALRRGRTFALDQAA